MAMSLLFMSCCGEVVETEINVIPHPASVVVYEGDLDVAGAAFKADAALGELALDAINGFEAKLVAASTKESGSSKAQFVFKADKNLAHEEYSIDVCCNKVVVKASDFNGVLYAIETLKQMLPEQIYTGAVACCEEWELP